MSGASSTARPAVASCHSEAGGRLAAAGARVVALVGAPNVGKSTLFNALTGARRDVGNWPGTTVEVGRGGWRLPAGERVALVDLPGAYSLDPVSPDEALTRALLVDAPPAERPDLVVVVADSARLARSLYLVAQLREQPRRVVVALTMADVARRRGLRVDPAALADALGVPVVALSPRDRAGNAELAAAVGSALAAPPPEPRRIPSTTALLTAPATTSPAGADEPPGHEPPGHEPPGHEAAGHEAAGHEPAPHEAADDELARADDRFGWVDAAVRVAVADTGTTRRSWSDRIDRVVTSPVIGPLVFLAAMWVVFQVTTTVAAPLQDLLDTWVAGPISDGVAAILAAVGLADTPVAGFVLDGLVAGVGMLLTFLPLMALMFAQLALLEDSGYLARAAVVTDRTMRFIGLPGRAFLPLVVGFGCNVPAISATRALPDARHRVLTALLVPFTSCSARLTVYVLVASVFFPDNAGTVVFAMYVVSLLLVVLVGLALRRTLWRTMGREPLVIDLPPYQVPHARVTAAVTWVRLRGFLRTASGIIVAAVSVVWLLQAVPAVPGASFGQVPVADSVYAAGARAIAPVFDPAGFGDWHAAGALVVGFVAKEAVISSWAQTYAAEEPADLRQPGGLGDAVRAEFEVSSGGYPQPAALAFLVFLLAYTPCVATLAAQAREIGRRWTALGVVVQLSVAWLLAVAVFQVGRWLA